MLNSVAQGRVILIGSNHGDGQAEYRFKRSLCRLANQGKIIFATEAISYEDKSGIVKTDFGCDQNGFGIESERPLALIAAVATLTHVRMLYGHEKTAGYIDTFFTQMRSLATLSAAVDYAMERPRFDQIGLMIRAYRSTVRSEHIHYLIKSERIYVETLADFLSVVALRIADEMSLRAPSRNLITRLSHEQIDKPLVDSSLLMMAKLRKRGMITSITEIDRQPNRDPKLDVIVVLGRGHIPGILEQRKYTHFLRRELANDFLTQNYGFQDQH